MRNVVEHNSAAWDRQADNGSRWTLPVDAGTIAAARQGVWSVILTPVKPVPREWFGDVKDRDVLCLASGGGQQAPVLAAAGAKITSFDNSARQLERDRFVAEREDLDIRLEKGDAADLSRFADCSFDLIFHPCSNCFMPELQPIWNECFRVLRPGGALLVGFSKPEVFIFGRYEEENLGKLVPRHTLPYSDQRDLGPEQVREMIDRGEALEFSHTLEEQIGGQIAAGFYIAGFYEDYWGDPENLFDRHFPAFVAMRAIKP